MSKHPTWLVRSIEVYSNETEELVGEHPLPAVDLALLQRLWNRPSSDPMFDMFEVTGAHREFIESVGLIPGFRDFSYFLSAHTTDSHAMQRDGGFMGHFAAPRNLPGFPEAKSAAPKTPGGRA